MLYISLDFLPKHRFGDRGKNRLHALPRQRVPEPLADSPDPCPSPPAQLFSDRSPYCAVHLLRRPLRKDLQFPVSDRPPLPARYNKHLKDLRFYAHGKRLFLCVSLLSGQRALPHPPLRFLPDTAKALPALPSGPRVQSLSPASDKPPQGHRPHIHRLLQIPAKKTALAIPPASVSVLHLPFSCSS